MRRSGEYIQKISKGMRSLKSYARLSGQVKDYDKYYDYNYVVVGTSYALHIREHVPPYWGVITVEMVDDRFDFYILRQPQMNPKVTWKKKMEILWRPELAMIQEWNPKGRNRKRDGEPAH